jgi:hypothetical protein
MARVFAQAQDGHPQSSLAAANVTCDLDTLPKIGAPAGPRAGQRRHTSLRQLAGVSRSELDKLHGMGPKALSILQAALAEHGLSLG